MSQFPSYLAGLRLTATLLGSAVPDVTVKQTGQIRTSTTTYADDAELAGVALGVGTWEIEVRLFTTGGNSAIPIKTQWGFSGTWNNPLRMIMGTTPANGNASSASPALRFDPQLANADSVYGMTGSAYFRVVEESRNVVVTVAGVMALRWAPNSSSANSGGVQAGSFLKVRRIA